MRRLAVRRRASRDLHEILIFSAREWGLDQAERYVRDIHGAFERILADPALGTTLSLPRGTYRRLNAGSHAIYFTASDTTVTIIRVLHQRMNSDRHLT